MILIFNKYAKAIQYRKNAYQQKMLKMSTYERCPARIIASPVIPAQGRRKQENGELKASLGY